MLKQIGTTFTDFIDAIANQIQISSEELTSYRSELDLVNAAIQAVANGLSIDPSQERALELWEEVKPSLSPLTVNTMTKIVSASRK